MINKPTELQPKMRLNVIDVVVTRVWIIDTHTVQGALITIINTDFQPLWYETTVSLRPRRFSLWHQWVSIKIISLQSCCMNTACFPFQSSVGLYSSVIITSERPLRWKWRSGSRVQRTREKFVIYVAVCPGVFEWWWVTQWEDRISFINQPFCVHAPLSVCWWWMK